jgi:hypothetical protein
MGVLDLGAIDLAVEGRTSLLPDRSARVGMRLPSTAI